MFSTFTATIRVSHRRIRFGLLACACLVFSAIGNPLGAKPSTPAATDLARHIERLLHDGDLAGARESLRAWSDLEPHDARLHYNLACLDARLDEPDTAVADLRRALTLGFDDIRRIAADPDLESLHGRNDLQAMIEDIATELAHAAARNAFSLDNGVWHVLSLHDNQGREASQAHARLRTTARGFELELSLPAGFFTQNEAPWYRGGGVVLTLAAPDSNETFDARTTWSFGYGLKGGLPVGALLSIPGRRLDQPIVELAPRLDWEPARGLRTLRATIPWTYLSPHLPPADTRFGINVATVPDAAGGGHALQLVDDPAARRRDLSRRRFLPFTVPFSPDGSLSFGGAVANTIVGATPLTFDLVVWSPHDGAGVLESSVRDSQGRSVVASGGDDTPITFKTGRNAWRRHADLSRLEEGPYQLVASVVLPDSSRLTWRRNLFRFSDEWLHSTYDRTKALAAAERPTILERLDLITDALAHRDPHASASPLITTVAETERLLANHDSTGTILAAGSRTQLYFTDEKGRLNPVTAYVEPHWRPDGSAKALVLNLDDDDVAALLKAWSPATGDGPPWVILQPDAHLAAASLRSLLDWAGDLLPRATLMIAARDTARLPEQSGHDIRALLLSGADPASQVKEILAELHEAP